MPLVNVKLIEGVFSEEQKQQIVRDLTEAMVAIEGENMRQVTWVIVGGGPQRRLGHRQQADHHRRRQGAGRRHPGELTLAGTPNVDTLRSLVTGPELPTPIGPYSQAVRAGGLLFVPGQPGNATRLIVRPAPACGGL